MCAGVAGTKSAGGDFQQRKAVWLSVCLKYSLNMAFGTKESK